jgi:N-acyl-D-amino-acid deacylase
MFRHVRVLAFFCLLVLAGCVFREDYDVVIRNGMIYDGSGSPPVAGSVAIRGDTIDAVGSAGWAKGRVEIDAKGMAVSPGFINMLSWATESLIADGRSQSEIRQGVTLEIFGEGMSMGPLNEAMKQELARRQGDIKYDVAWTTLDEYLEHLVKRGVSPNIASFVGATTVRVHVLGYVNRAPTGDELERMRELVRQAMREGALGVASALIYAPGAYGQTDELVALAESASKYNGLYISHMRSEGDRLIEGVQELVAIAKRARIPAEIYHLKAGGRANWDKMAAAIRLVENARGEGHRITADMYTYTAGSTGLDAAMPPWVQEGGHDAWVARLKDPAIRQRIRKEMSAPGKDWENLYHASGSAKNVLLVGFKNEELKPLTGKSLAEVAAMRGASPEDTAMDLVIHDDSRVDCVYFLMSEENVQQQIKLPWVSFGSDAASLAPEGVFLKSSTHPRAYGNFARLLAKYVRQEKIIPLQEAVHRLTSLPAENLKLDRRGLLKKGYFADVVVFDPMTIQDHATYTQPQQYSTGVQHVFVNGVQVLRNGEHTGAKPGRVVRGPGYRKP